MRTPLAHPRLLMQTDLTGGFPLLMAHGRMRLFKVERLSPVCGQRVADLGSLMNSGFVGVVSLVMRILLIVPFLFFLPKEIAIFFGGLCILA